MIKKPILVVMAAGLGSRYGGLKQMVPSIGFAGTILTFALANSKGEIHVADVCRV